MVVIRLIELWLINKLDDVTQEWLLDNRLAPGGDQSCRLSVIDLLLLRVELLILDSF